MTQFNTMAVIATLRTIAIASTTSTFITTDYQSHEFTQEELNHILDCPTNNAVEY